MAAIPLGRRLPGASSSQPGRLDRRPAWNCFRVVPIRLCSRWGLPCRFRRRKRGALLPHLFTLTPMQDRGGTFSVALSLRSLPACAGTGPAGRYPAPCLRGARTFLCAHAQRPPGRLTLIQMRPRAARVKVQQNLTNRRPGRAPRIPPPASPRITPARSGTVWFVDENDPGSRARPG